MKKNRLVALILAALFVLTTLAACTPTPTTTTDPTDAPVTTGDPATVDPTPDQPGTTTEKVYRTYMGTDCPIMNGHDSVETSLQTPHDYCSGFLFRTYPGEDGLSYVYIPDLAAELPIQVDEEGRVWQFKLREEACWHNGEPINADTWIYSLKNLIDPVLANKMGGMFADYILNGKDYFMQGTAGTVAWEDVGIKKIDDYTLEITYVDVKTQHTACTPFTGRDMAPVYEPYYEAGMNDTRTETTYGTTLDNWMGCGPYFFDTWTYDSIQVYKKNPDHWLADLFNYDTVEVRIVPEMNARVELWESGMLDSLTPDANTLETYLDDSRLVSYPSLSVYHIDINCKNPANPICGSVAYRKAIYHAVDRATLAEYIFGHMIPSGVYVNELAGIESADHLTYRESKYGKAVTDLVESWGPYGYNPEMALDYLKQAYAECNVSEDTVITIKMAIDESDATWKACAEFFQEEFPKIFNGMIQVEIVTYAGMGAGDFKATGDDKWDFSPNDWTRSLSRTYPYQCFYYYLSTYGSHPNNFFDEEFEAQFAYCDTQEIKNDYETLLAETQKLEELYLEKVIQVPVVQVVNYELFSDHLQLPVSTYVPGFGWGAIYGDIVE